MKLRYIGQPNHTILELIVAGVVQSGEALEVGKIYDIPTDDKELNRKIEDLIKGKVFEKVTTKKVKKESE